MSSEIKEFDQADRSRLRQILSILWIGLLSSLLLIITMVVATGLLMPILQSIETPLRLWIAYLIICGIALIIGLILGFWRGKLGPAIAAVSGGGAGLFLLLFRLSLGPDDAFNPLIFSWSGAGSLLVLSTIGGLLGRQISYRREPVARQSNPIWRLLLGGALVWTVAEVVVRSIGALGLGSLLGNPLIGDMILVALTFPVIAWTIARWGRSHTISPPDWAYRWDTNRILLGGAAGLFIVLSLNITQWIDSLLFASNPGAVEQLTTNIESSIIAALLLLLVNGLIVPISEEWAWRAVLQSAADRILSPLIAILLVGLLFALKHVVVDGSFFRFTSLLLFALVVGVVRHRLGSGAATVTHIVANMTATSILLLS